jgi:hypothetical protein
MAGMFYSLKDVMAKMNKTEDEISALVKQGRLREFRDGPNVLFKIDEVESLMSDTTFMASQKKADAKPEDEEVELVIEGEEEKPKTDADTTAVASEGVNVLGETDTEISLTDDTLAATRASGATAIIEGALSGSKPGTGEASLEELEQNVNLDTFGSGSGLLDLSLQADDTSLGGILDEIYTPEGEEGKEAQAKEGSEIELAAEADQLVEQPAASEAIPAEGLTAVAAAPESAAFAYIEPAPDAADKILSIMLFIPLLTVIYAIVVAMAGQKQIASSVLALKGLTWPIIGGAAVITAVLSAMAFLGGGPKKPKAPKVKKEKKSKKGKKGEEPAAEAPVETAPAEGTTAVAEPAQVEADAEVAAAKTGTATAESADFMNLEEPLGDDEDLKLEDLDLSDVKDISDEADKL